MNIDFFNLAVHELAEDKFKSVGTDYVIWKEETNSIPIDDIKMKAIELENAHIINEEIKLQKTQGEPYTTLSPDNISFTNEDAMGMLQVKTAFELGLTETVVEFSNGTKLPIKAEDFLDFATWFVEKRNAFFI